jgi:serine/threonine-protein kinase
VRLLGAGAVGRVFEVEHLRLGRRAAMKTLASAHAAHPAAIRRLFAEALAVNRINNPHIVEVTDLVERGEHRRERPARGGGSASLPAVYAIVMELLDGQSLAQAVTREGSLEPERFLPVLAQVSRALAAAHGVGFVHRDLKPDNVFLVDRGRRQDFVKLLDFGLAKALRADPSPSETPPSSPSSTLDGVFVGTPAYVSPEQAAGRAVDHRGDIYAIGVMLFELITGRLPFEAPSTAELLIQHVSAPAPHLPADVRATRLGATLDAITQRCLEKDPAARFPSAAPLARMFDDLARGGEVAFTGLGGYLARRPPRPAPVRSEWARGVAGVGIGLLLALGTGVAVAHLRAGRRPPGAGARPTSTHVAAGTSAAPGPIPASPAPATQVTLAFESDPPGAEVFLDDGGRLDLLGTTPFERSFPRRERVVPFEFRLAGHTPMRVPTPMTSSRAIQVTLPYPAVPRRVGVPASVDRKQTLDPFR